MKQDKSTRSRPKSRTVERRKMTSIPGGDLGNVVFASSVPFDLNMFSDPRVDIGRSYKQLHFPHTVSQMNIFRPAQVELLRYDVAVSKGRTFLDIFHLGWFNVHVAHTADWPRKVDNDSIVVHFIGIPMRSKEYPDDEFFPQMEFRRQQKVWVPAYSTADAVRASRSLPWHLFAVI